MILYFNTFVCWPGVDPPKGFGEEGGGGGLQPPKILESFMEN